jgi:hypothetical protein
MLASRASSSSRRLIASISASTAAAALIAFASPCEATEPPAPHLDSPRVRFGLSGSHGIAVVGQGSWYLTYPEFVGLHARLGVQWNDRLSTFATFGGSPIPWLFSYDAGLIVEWTPLPFLALGTGASLYGFPITDAAAHAIGAPIAISFMPWRRSSSNRHAAFTITLSVAPAVTVYMPTDGCFCASGAMRENGFTFVSRLEVGFDLR